nr:DHHA1 domain-containing protein [Candidatus Sigynarchaeota archaeon]
MAGNENKFLENLDNCVAAFQDMKPARAISISHNDGDGLTASAMICKTLEMLKVPAIQVIFERSKSWDEYFRTLLPRYPGIDTVFVSDLGAEEKQMCNVFGGTKTTVFLLDHHKVLEKEQVETYPDNVFSANPTRFGFDGLKEIAGSTLVYMFCERLTKRAKKLAWLPVVGMAGDTLKNPSNYESFNQEVVEIALEEGLVSYHDGLAPLGGMAEPTLDKSLAFSIVPFIKDFGGSPARARVFIEKLGLDPAKNVMSLTAREQELLSRHINEPVTGKSIMLHGNEGILEHAFEYNFFISLVGDEDHKQALDIFGKKKLPKENKKHFDDYMHQLVSNLGTISSKASLEGDSFIFFEFPSASKQVVSDTASFTSVNALTPDDKVLIIATRESATKVKLSLRSSWTFVDTRHTGVGNIIDALSRVFGGRGGGHDVAGGWNVDGKEYEAFLKDTMKIDNIIKTAKRS